MMNIAGITLVLALVLQIPTGMSTAEKAVSGTVTSIDLTSRTITIDPHDGRPVQIVIRADDTETLNKFRQKRIMIDDEIRVKYIVTEGKNVATYLRKTAGC